MTFRLMALGALALGLSACQQQDGSNPTPDPVGDITKLVGTWTGAWTGQDGAFANQRGAMTLVVAADGKLTCKLTNVTRGGQTDVCTGLMVGNPKQANHVFLTADYTYANEPKVSAKGTANFLPQDTALNRPKDMVIGAVNNVAAPGGATAGDIGNLYFSLSK